MKHNEIVEIAKQAGIETDWSFDFQVRLEAFAKLVAQHEREACAKICEELSHEMSSVGEFAAKVCEKFIREQQK
jgi:hypothetical protein